MALEDGYVLAACLKKYLPRRHGVRPLRGPAQGPHLHRGAQGGENRTACFRHNLADNEAIAELVAKEWQQERLRERMDWLYTYDATAVAV